MTRTLALVYGGISYLIFFVSFLYAIGFTGNIVVPKGIDGGAEGPLVLSAFVNILLMGLFAIQHSVMARPAFKRWWTQFVPKPVERSTYVLFASLILLLLYWLWQPMTATVWHVTGVFGQTVIWGLFALGWSIVLLSTFMIGHFDLFGLKQVYYNWQSRSLPDAEFKEPGFYKFVRHPIMSGFVVAFWATPHMTAGHLLFATVTTAYILIAIQLEERDLIALLGKAYLGYRERVPALVPFVRRGGRRTERAA